MRFLANAVFFQVPYVTKRGLSADPLPSLLVHVVIECPHMQNITSIQYQRFDEINVCYYCIFSRNDFDDNKNRAKHLFCFLD